MNRTTHRPDRPGAPRRRTRVASLLTAGALLLAGLAGGSASVAAPGPAKAVSGPVAGVASADASSVAARPRPRRTPKPRPTRTAQPTASPSSTPTPTPTPSASTPDRPQTVVSLTFDDGNADQAPAATVLAEHGLAATFFVISGAIGTSGYLTRAQLDTLVAQGHEIGGHTVSHPDLTTLTSTEAKRQVCYGREILADWGFQVRSFAYPYAASTPATEQVVAECGFNSARGLGDVAPEFGVTAEDIPPPNPFLTRAPDQVTSSWTLQDLQRAVTTAEEAGGGWVQLTFHRYDTGGELSVSAPTFASFVSWLSAREATLNTVVRTVGDVIGGPVQPVVPTSDTSNPPLEPGVNGTVNDSYEDVSASGVPVGGWNSTYGDTTSTFSLVGGRTGAVASRIETTAYTSGDAKLLASFDLGECAPTVAAGHTYSLRSWYTSTTATQFAVYLRNSLGGWEYWTSSPWFASASTWSLAAWTTPQVPEGYTGISFGLNIFGVGVLTTDDVAIYDSVGAPPLDTSPAQ